MRDLLAFYDVSEELHDHLLRLAHDARQKEPWWRAYEDAPDVRTYVAFEESASSICSYESLVIPGPIQVEEYARIIIGSVLPNLSGDKLDRLVQLRLKRQSLLREGGPVTLHVVLDEAAIHRMVGHRDVMRRQLAYLLEAASTSKVNFQLLPFSAGPHPGMAGPFTILGFADPADRDIVYLESSTGDVYLDEPEQLRQYHEKFGQLQLASCTPDESRVALVELAGRYDLELDCVEFPIARAVDEGSPLGKIELHGGSIGGL